MSRVTSKLGPLFQQIGDMMNSRTLFEFNSSLLDSTLRWRCAASSAGRQRVRRGDYIMHLTTRPVNRGLRRVVDDREIGQGLEFVIRPSRHGGGVEHEEEEAYRFGILPLLWSYRWDGLEVPRPDSARNSLC